MNCAVSACAAPGQSCVYDPSCAAYEHEGLYTELQVGPAATQRHTFEMPARSAKGWVEWFKGWKGDVGRLHAEDYGESVAAVEEWRASAGGMNASRVARVTAELERLANVAPRKDQILSRGMPWGGLEEEDRRHRFGSSASESSPAERVTSPSRPGFLGLLSLHRPASRCLVFGHSSREHPPCTTEF